MSNYHFGDRVHGDKIAGDKHVGPVVHGDSRDSQFAWNTTTANQNQQHAVGVRPEFQALADAVTAILERLDSVGLGPGDAATAREAGADVLAQARSPQPDGSVVRRALAALKGVLAPIALGVSAGTSDAVKDWARATVDHLSALFT